MAEIFQSFYRAVLAILSGGMLLIGTAHWADWFGGCGSVWNVVFDMLNDTQQRGLLLLSTGVIAYIIGMINVAGSALLFGRFVSANKDDELLLISRIEAAGQPQLLKQVLELLHIKHTLVGFSFPLVYLGCALPLDYKAWGRTCDVPTSVLIGAVVLGALLVLFGVLAPVFAAWMDRRLAAVPAQLQTSGAATHRTASPSAGSPE